MENFLDLVPLVVLFPLAGLLINLFMGAKLGEKGVGIVAVGAAGLSFLVAVLMGIALADTGYHAAVVNFPLLSDWIRIPSAGVSIPWALRVDSLSVTMMLVVTGVGTLIHIYAIGYMHGDERFPRFFVYLNLFLFFMLILVTGNNFLVLFVGWEGVGLCSYLLIGFWFDKPAGEGWRNSDAARKAFIVNRIGDYGVVLTVLLTFWTFGTLTFYHPGEAPIAHEAEAAGEPFVAPAEGEEAHAGPAGPLGVFNQAEIWLAEGNHQVRFGSIDVSFKTMLTVITLLMLLGATGKSAQIPLFVWLPDAMAGPTPVSALIHAATMVTAGVYMMVRSNVFFHAADVTSFVVAVIGATTALVAGFIAVGQWDIKKVLAYSTVSQLGFMVAAVGVGAYAAAMFHLVTHACFKALLFLGSGSVIHGVEHGHHLAEHHGHAEPHVPEDEHQPDVETGRFDPQDMRNMGGLRHRMPLTFWTYVIGTLALAGIFPFAGFWSKDEILLDSLRGGVNEGMVSGFIAFALLLTAAVFTAFYMWRQVSLVFLGEPRTDAAAHAPESASVMTTPLVVLAVLSVLIGLINVPSGFPIFDWVFGEHHFTAFLEHSVTYAHAAGANLLLALVAVLLALGAIYAASRVYNRRALREAQVDPLQRDPRTAGAFALSSARLYWDEAYYRYLVFPFRDAAYWLADRVDWAFWHEFVHNRLLRDPFNAATAVLAGPVDKGFIDRAFDGVAHAIRRVAQRMRRVQVGYVRTYALGVLFGALLVILIVLYPLIRDWLGM